MPRERVVRSAPVIPDHEVVRQIGSGAYGSVWLARSLTGAWRAVKIVCREDFDNDRTFNREFEGIQFYEPIARNHPGLVHILHVGRKDGPNPFYYYVMELGDDAQAGVHIDPAEYIPRTLHSDKKLAGDKPLPLDYCLEVGSQLSHALLYLHSKGLTHRDIKPSNVIFVNGRPKLADIGLVAHNGQRSFVGTEGFIPPEGPGSERADVYALAKVLYEITTGKDRMDFPELPEELPEGVVRKKWLALNNIICSAAEPRLEEAAIVSAEVLTESLDALRGFTVHPKFRFPRRKRRMRSATKVTLSALIGAACAVGATIWITSVMQGNEPGTQPNLPLNPVQTPIVIIPETKPATPSHGFVIITSVPPRASIYDKNGRYVDETPYGPAMAPTGETLTYTLKKIGYADWEESGTVEGGKTLAIGGQLKPYNPPIEGKFWKDTEGVRYVPDGENHMAEEGLTVDLFKKFLDAETLGPTTKESIPYEEIAPSPNSTKPPLVMTSLDGIGHYLRWLSSKCEQEGILGKEFRLTAEPIAGFTSSNGELHAYKLVVSKMYQVPISIITTPPGASVFLNKKLIGFTPLNDYMINQEPYVLEIKLPGHAPMRRSGLDPQGLYLSLQLEQDRSVVYHSNWENSLGMNFVPLSENTLAQTYEVTCMDFELFVKDTNGQAPPKPDFQQGDKHPIVNVTREEAEQFAHWLTMKERSLSLIEPLDQYRLPTDEEWSQMAGTKGEQGNTPHERSLAAISERAVYYWGYAWPPKDKTGNFADRSALIYLPSQKIITGYDDLIPYTAEVGTFSPNVLGLYDIDGNVQEWVSDAYGGTDKFKFKRYDVARGGSYLSFKPYHLNPAIRTPLSPGTRDPGIGFRLVLVRESQERASEQTQDPDESAES